MSGESRREGALAASYYEFYKEISVPDNLYILKVHNTNKVFTVQYMKIPSYSVVFMFIIFIFTSSICITGESTRSDDVVTFSYLLCSSALIP